MCRISISGYYGFNNVGDEAILVSIIESLKKSVDDVDITVLSANPNMTSKKHEVRAVDRKSIKGIFKAIKECDLFISGGGSLLQDVTSRRSIIYYLVVLLIALVYRKKILIYSQGIGPINETFNRIFTKIVLNKCDVITIRDNKSKTELLDMGITKPPMYVSADPVIGLSKVGLNFGQSILGNEKKVIGFAMRGWKNNKEFNEKICKVADKVVSELGYHVAFIPFHYGEDMKIMEYMKKHMKNNALFIDKRYEINEMLSIIGACDLLVGVRLHSLIFAAVMNTPMVAISYDPKINSFMESINHDTSTNVKKLDEDKLLKDIENKINSLEKEKNYLKDQVDNIKEKLKINNLIVQKLIKGEKI